MTYGELMKRHRLSRGRKLSMMICEVDRAEGEHGRPGFAAIVVRKDTGLPGGGYFCDDSLPPGLRRPKSRASDPKLSPEEVRHVLGRRHAIWEFYSGGRPRAPRR